MRLFTTLFVAKRHSVDSHLFMRSDLKEVFDRYEVEMNNEFGESPQTNAIVTTGASAISKQRVLKENGLILE